MCDKPSYKGPLKIKNFKKKTSNNGHREFFAIITLLTNSFLLTLSNYVYCCTNVGNILVNEVLYWIRIIRESGKYNIVWPKLKGLKYFRSSGVLIYYINYSISLLMSWNKNMTKFDFKLGCSVILQLHSISFYLM